MISAHKGHREPVADEALLQDDVNFVELARSTDDFNGAQLKVVFPGGFQRVDTVDGGFVLAKRCTSTSQKGGCCTTVDGSELPGLPGDIFEKISPCLTRFHTKTQVVQDFFHQQIGGVNPR